MKYLSKVNFKNEVLNVKDNVSNFIGEIKLFAGDTAPENYMLCNGQAISRTTYSDLFSVIGTKFGAGNNSTTFNLPNFSGKVPIGKDSNDTNFNQIGKSFGEKKHKLNVTELPTLTGHLAGIATHSSIATGIFTATREGPIAIPAGQGNDWTTIDINFGGNGSHNIIQPSLSINYIIKVK